MADKKSDDVALRMPEAGDEERALAAARRGAAPAASSLRASVEASGGASVAAYCLSSISMTLVNKYVVSGRQWNLHLLYLAIQVSFFS